MEIRPAKPGDIPGIGILLRQVCNVHHAIRPDIFRQDAMKYDAAALAEILREPHRPVFVAAEADRVLGYCFCIRRDFLGSSGALTERVELYIDDLCVEESSRGQGIATALYRHVTDYAKSIGAAFLTLNVWCGNDAAMAFYEHAGLTPRSITMEMPLL